MKKALISAFGAVLTGILTLAAQNFSGNYTGFINETETVTLSLNMQQQDVYSGTLKDSQQSYEVNAVSLDGKLTGTATESNLGLTFDLEGILQGNQLTLNLAVLGSVTTVLMTKAGTAATNTKPAPSTATATPKPGKRDPNVVGKWTHQTNYNSGYGQEGTMSNEESIIFNDEGTLSNGGSRTVTGGSDWSGTSGSAAGGVIPGLYWYTENQQIFLTTTQNGKTETASLGRYYIEDGKMLITGADGTKMLYYKY